MNQPVTGVPQMLPTQVIDTSTDSREILKHARLAARRRKLHEWFVVDVDAHHVETVSWNEIVQYIDDPVVRDQALHFHKDRIGAPPYGLNGDLGLRYQSVGGRIPHQDGLREKVEDTSVHRDVTLTRRAMDSLGVDNMVVFPTPLLFLGLHPQPEMEVWLSRAYNKWMQEKLLSADNRIKFLAVLPYNTPEECERTVKETAGKKGIIGYAVPSTRHAPVLTHGEVHTTAGPAKLFRDLVAQDKEITARLSPDKMERTFDLQRQLRNVDAIFDRILKYEAVPA